MNVAAVNTTSDMRGNLWAVLLLVGAAAVLVPTMYFIASTGWTGEEGAHAPIILATGLWLFYTNLKAAAPHFARPSWVYPVGLLAFLLPLYFIARVTQIAEIEGYVMYACLLAVLYSLIGLHAMKLLWFPLFYLAFAFPPPETVVAALTLPLKMWISQAAVWFLDLLGYPIGRLGVSIFIGQYQLLVAAACAGLNTIISLSAISLFYAYARHRANPRYVAFLAVLVVPIALFANFIRVLILILLTYHFGEATGQGFMHNFAGLFMFMVALGTIFLIDEAIQIRRARRRAGHAMESENV